MMMIVDANHTDKAFEVLTKELEALGREIGVTIKIQHEDIFNTMHRI